MREQRRRIELREPRGRASLRLLWSGGSRLATYVAIVASADAAMVSLVPTQLGYPYGGIFLLEALPAAAFSLFLAAALTLPAIIVCRARVGLAAAMACSAALAALGLIDVYLWLLCVASV